MKPVKNSSVKAEVNNPQSNAKVHANEKQGFDMPLFAMGASGEIADIIRETYTTNAKGAADYGAKIIEISSVNASSAFDFLTHLMGTKSLSEIIQLSATQSRKNFEVTSAQNKELWELAQKVATETAEPIKKSFTRVLQKAS
jgi:phasin